MAIRERIAVIANDPSTFNGNVTFGTKAKLAFGASSSTAQTGYHLSSSLTNALAVYADDNNVALGDAVYSTILARTMIFQPITAGTVRSLTGQLKLADEADLGPGVFAGVQGYLELYDDADVKSGGKVWAVDATIEAPSGGILTVDSGGILGALHAELTGAGTLTDNGTTAGLYIDEQITSGVWGYGVYVANSAVTTGIRLGTCTTGLLIDGDETTGISLTSNLTATDGILIAGANADAIHISGSNTTSALHISGDQAIFALFDVDAAATDGLKISVDDGITLTTGINLCRSTTTGVATTGILVDTDGTTAISIGAGFTGVTGLEIAGTASGDGVLISGACADAVHISGTNTATGLHISGDQVVFALFDVDAAATDGLKILVDDGITLTTGINLDRSGTTGIVTTGISIDTDGTTGISIAAGFTGVTGLEIAGTASGDGILVSGACADGLHISGTNTANGLHISGDQAVFALFDVDAAATDGLKILVDDGITVDTGINLARTGTTGIATTGLSIDTDGTTAISIGTGFTGTTGLLIAGTATNGISITGACPTAINIGAAVGTGIQLGTSGAPVTLAASTNHGIAAYTTSANASTETDGFLFNSVFTGVGGIDVGLRANMATNVKLGSWANAAYISLDLMTNGGVAGLGSVLCAELTMGAAATEGTFGVFEGEIGCPASWTGTGPVSFLYFNTYGDTKANFDTYGYFLTLTGVASGANNMLYVNTSNAADACLRCLINGTPYYILLSADTTFA